MGLQRPWLDSMPKCVTAQIEISQYQSILSVLDQVCEKYADKPGFASFGTQLSYGEIERLSRQFASWLINDIKLKKGDRVALMMPNLLQYPIAIFGVLRAGMTVVNTNPMYTARDLKHQLVDSGASAIVVLEEIGRASCRARVGQYG